MDDHLRSVGGGGGSNVGAGTRELGPKWLPLIWFINALTNLFAKEQLLLPTKPQKQSLVGSLTIVNVDEDIMGHLSERL